MKKLLFDFFPVILFFIAFKLEDDPKRGIMIATAVVIVATLASKSGTCGFATAASRSSTS